MMARKDQPEAERGSLERFPRLDGAELTRRGSEEQIEVAS
jgi:hypothetical protein